MSTFTVDVVEIKEVADHPNADRLELVTLVGLGWKVISAKGNFKPGDKAWYFPLDSIIPDEWVEAFGIKPYYHRKLKAAKLRGVYSEGLCIPLRLEYIDLRHNLSQEVGTDWKDHFGVTKYEHPLPRSMGGDAENAIGHYRFPGPEHLKKYPYLLTPGEEVVITEKIHGTNYSVLVTDDGVTKVASHNYFWKLDSEANKGNVYVRVHNTFTEFQRLPANTQVFGEIYGVQDLKYGLTNGALDYRIFAVRQDGEFLNYDEFVAFCNDWGLKQVPLLYRGPYDQGIVESFNNTDSTLDSRTMMEGVVVQPVIERTHPKINDNRIVLKFISERYSLRKEGSELH